MKNTKLNDYSIVPQYFYICEEGMLGVPARSGKKYKLQKNNYKAGAKPRFCGGFGNATNSKYTEATPKDFELNNKKTCLEGLATTYSPTS